MKLAIFHLGFFPRDSTLDEIRVGTVSIEISIKIGVVGLSIRYRLIGRPLSFLVGASLNCNIFSLLHFEDNS